MKFSVKVIIICSCIIVVFSSCQKSDLQLYTGINYSTNRKIEKLLRENSISYSSISDSANDLLLDTNKDFCAYDLKSTEGDYTLILKQDKKTLVALLDSENNLLFGFLDNSIIDDMDRYTNQ